MNISSIRHDNYSLSGFDPPECYGDINVGGKVPKKYCLNICVFS